MMARTYSQAQGEILTYLVGRGWRVQAALKTPWAESPDGSIRLWFKPQAVWFSRGGTSLAAARSTWLDVRQYDGPRFLATIEKVYMHGDRRRSQRGR